jgi:PAS domain S-box-containing protein
VRSPLRILIISDNHSEQTGIIRELEREFPDLQVLHVSEERACAGAVEAGGFDVVLCRDSLSWADGLVILRAIKARWPEVPAVIVADGENEEMAVEAVKAGVDGYVLSPHTHPARLLLAVRSALDRVGRHRHLEEGECRYQAFFDRVPVGLYRSTPGGKFLDVNPALVEILGYPSRKSLEEADAAHLYLHPEDRDRWQRQVECEGVVRNFEVPFRRWDGSTAWLRNSARAVRDHDGRLLWYEGILEAIPGREPEKETLAEPRRQLEGMRAATAEIIRELKLPALLDLIVRRAVELVGGTSGCIYLWDEIAQAVAPSAWYGSEGLFEAVSSKLGEGVVGSVAERRRGLVVNGHQATPIAGPLSAADVRTAATVAEPLEYGGRLLGVIAIASEGDNRHFSESDQQILGLFASQAAVAIENARLFGEVSHAKQEWESTFDAAADLIIIMNLERHIVRANRALAGRLQVHPRDVIGQRCDEVFEGCEGCSDDCAFLRCVRSRRPVTEEREVPRTGEVFLQTYSPFLDAGGKMVGVVQISKDVTIQRQLQRQLARSEKMVALGRLVSGVAHELNNPLTAILGNAQLLLQGAASETSRQQAEHLVSEAESAAKIVRSLITFARSRKSERQSVLLDQLIEDALILRAQQQRLRKIAVARTLAPEVPAVLADPQQIQQVILDLLINAEQAIGERSGGEIEIATSVDPAKKWVKVVIADNGPGIPVDIQGKIFDPFFTTKEVGKGIGLGLAICDSIIQEHGGRIQVSNRPQGGARFEVELPALDGAGVEAPSVAGVASATTARPPATPAGGERILVVDDQEAILHLVAEALRMVGKQVEVAKDGRMAIEKLGAGEFDLVLMDMKMPGFDGEHIYDEVIRRMSAPPRVIIMTGDTVNKETRRFLERTGLRCIEKPFRLEDIWDCVRDLEGPSPVIPDPKASDVPPLPA